MQDALIYFDLTEVNVHEGFYYIDDINNIFIYL